MPSDAAASLRDNATRGMSAVSTLIALATLSTDAVESRSEPPPHLPHLTAPTGPQWAPKAVSAGTWNLGRGADPAGPEHLGPAGRTPPIPTLSSESVESVLVRHPKAASFYGFRRSFVAGP